MQSRLLGTLEQRLERRGREGRLVIVEADADDLVAAMRQHHVEEFEAAIEAEFAAVGGDQSRRQAGVGLDVGHRGQNAGQHRLVGDAMRLMGVGRQEELDMAGVAGGAAFQHLVGDAVEVVGVADRAADEVVDFQEIRQIVIAVEFLDLAKGRQRHGILPRQIDEGRRPNGALEMKVQFDLGDAARKTGKVHRFTPGVL